MVRVTRQGRTNSLKVLFSGIQSKRVAEGKKEKDMEREKRRRPHNPQPLATTGSL